MNIRFTRSAEGELREAYQFYESKAQGLGEDFARKVGRAADWVRRHPTLLAPFSGDVRRCRVARFPYALVYKVKADHVRVLAVMHLKRRPGYWEGRDEEEDNGAEP